MGFIDELLSGITDQQLGITSQKQQGKLKKGKQEQTQDQSHGQSEGQGLGSMLFDHVGNMIAQAGGITGLVKQFKEKDLGDVIVGWVGTGANPAISPGQITKALGEDKISAAASTLGLTKEQIAQSLSKLLPAVVDKLTPGGKVAQNESPGTVQQAMNRLRSTFLS